MKLLSYIVFSLMVLTIVGTILGTHTMTEQQETIDRLRQDSAFFHNKYLEANTELDEIQSSFEYQDYLRNVGSGAAGK